MSGNAHSFGVPAIYAARPSLFTQRTLPDTEFVNDGLAGKQDVAQRNQANGYASLDGSAQIALPYLKQNIALL